jgi:hypothetical protein
MIRSRTASSICGGRSPLAPAYYQGRPAQAWLEGLDRRHYRLSRNPMIFGPGTPRRSRTRTLKSGASFLRTCS